MFSKATILAALIAYAEARFGQEQVPISAISAVKGGAPGAAATIAGAAISDLLGAANSCAKLTRADQIVSELGGGADAIAAAIGMVTAEKNTNPFANNNTQNVCSDPALPATAELRGITPLIDPAVDVNGAVAALSKQTAASPLDATGLSVFDLLVNAGFGDLVKGQAAAGGAAAGGAAAGGNNGNANNGNANNGNANNGNANNGNANNGNANNGNANNGNANNGNAAAGNANDECADATETTAAAAAPAATSAAASAGNAGNAGNGNAGQAAAGNGNVQQSTIAGLDFGTCIPTIIFEGGLGGRPATEFTFQLADPVARKGQQEALNPNIITNRVCDQLTNVCGANQAAKDACTAAKAKVAALGTRNKATADTFNTALGFAGFVTNPDGGPADVTAKRALKFRA